MNERFTSIEEEADALVSDYGLEDEVEQGVIREYLKIVFAEDIVLFIDERLWEAKDGVRRLLDDPEST